MIKYSGIHHLAMATGDMDTTIRFWRDLLGMRLVAGFGHRGYRQYFFEISEKDMITFFEWPGTAPVMEKEHGRPVKGPFAFDHVSFGLETEEELWKLKDRLEASGTWVSEVIDHGFIYSLYAFDPNGIPIEFSCPVPGVDVRKEPMMADRDPSAVTQQGPGPRLDVWPDAQKPMPKAERKRYPGVGSDLFPRKRM